MLSARHIVMPRWAKSRHTPERWANTSCAVVVEVLLPGLYSMLSWIQRITLRTREMPGASLPNRRCASAPSRSDSQ